MNTEWLATCQVCKQNHMFNQHINPLNHSSEDTPKETVAGVYNLSMESIKYTLNKEEVKKVLKAAGWAFGAAGFYALSEWVLTADLQVNIVWIPVLNTLFYAVAKFMEGKKK